MAEKLAMVKGKRQIKQCIDSCTGFRPFRAAGKQPVLSAYLTRNEKLLKVWISAVLRWHFFLPMAKEPR